MTKKRKELEDPSNSSITKRSKTARDDQHISEDVQVTEITTSVSSAKPRKTITDLSDEMLQKILEFAVGPKCARFLDLSLVCHQWNDLISTSLSIVNNLKPKIKLEPSKNVEKAASFPITRKYHELTLELKKDKLGIYNANPFLVMTSISTTLSDNLKSLTLDSLTINPYFIGALHSLENLQNLTLVRCEVEHVVEIDKVQFKGLENLKLMSTTGTILSWLKCEKLKSFSFEAQIISSYLIGFLNQLKHLDELIIKEWKGWENSRIALKPEFKWEKFEFLVPGYASYRITSWYLHLSNNAIANILALCQASSQNAEAHITFDWNCFNESEADDMVNILNSCTAIKTLTIGGYGAIKTNLSKLRSLDEVETLIMPQVDGFEKFIEKLPNVKHLTLTLSCDKYNFQVLPQLKLLEHLDISTILRPIPKFVESAGSDLLKLPKLQSITVSLKVEYAEKKWSDPLRYELTGSLWRFCSYNPSVKHVQFNVNGGPWWRKTYSDGQLTENSLISVYKSWSNYTTSVELCKFIINRNSANTSKGLRKTREEKEVEVFGRILSEKEKQFFSEMIIDGWND